MADPRDTISQEGIGAQHETFIIDDSTIVYSATEDNGSAGVGLAVTFSDDKTIQLVGDAEFVLGKLITVSKDKKATVQTRGNMTLPGHCWRLACGR
jgi:hypothetical protein